MNLCGLQEGVIGYFEFQGGSRTPGHRVTAKLMYREDRFSQKCLGTSAKADTRQPKTRLSSGGEAAVPR